MAARGRAAGMATAMTVAAFLAACSAPPHQPAPTPDATSAALGDAPPSFTAVAEADFLAPSGNIGCHLDKSSARCDIVRKNWQPPPAPADCELDWGFGISVSGEKEARFTCAGDTVLGAKEKLAYGESLRAGDFLCSSDSKAMRCENTVSRHGFTLAVERYQLF